MHSKCSVLNKLNQEDIWGYKNLTITSTISESVNAEAVPNYNLLFVPSKWKIDTQWIHVCTAVDPKLDIGRWVIYLHALDSWFSKTKTIHFNEEQIHNSPASRLAVGQSSDEWQWKVNCQEGESTLPGLSSRLAIENFPIHRQNLTDSVDSELKALMEPPQRKHHVTWTNQ